MSLLRTKSVEQSCRASATTATTIRVRDDGGPCRDRTDDIHGVNVALYQLS